ncbi:MAG TPA: pitrilysin family protein [Candidatus Eisenbacteria bacterium]
MDEPRVRTAARAPRGLAPLAGVLLAAFVATTSTPPALAGSTSKTRTRSMTSTATPATLSPVYETTLDNGLSVLIQEVHTAPVAAFMVWYRTGSRNEDVGTTGISHLLEHMMFKGTPTYGKGEIAKILQKNGASFNAGTSLDYTNYYEVLASDRLELAMKIESDRMVNALIPDEEHRLEMTVVRSELERNEDNPHRALYNETFAQAFQVHPYHWPTIGWRVNVEQIRTEQIRDYYKTHYMPNNATVVVVGDIDRDKTLEMVKRYFGPIPRGAEPPPVTTVEPPQQGERRFKLRKPGDTPYLMVAYRNPALADSDNYALDVLGIVLGHGKTSRLYRALVEKKLAAEVDAGNETGRDPFLFIAQATVASEATLDSVEHALEAEVERLKNEPVTAEELARAKKQVEASFVYSKDSIRSLAQQLGYYNTVASWKYIDTYLDRIAEVTTADVQRVAAKYLVADSRTVGWFDPLPETRAGGDGAGAGGASEPAKAVARYRPLDDGAGAGEEAREPAAALEPAASSGAAAAPGVRLARTQPVRTVLPNGLTLVVERNPANPTISLQAVVKAGGIFDPPGKSGLAAFVADMLDKGTPTRTASDIATAVENVGAALSFDGGAETVTCQARMLSPDLGTMLDVLADLLAHPSFPDEKVEQVRAERITNYRIMENSTSSVAARRANTLLYPVGHPYHDYPAGTDTTLKAITRQDLVAYHASHYGPNNTILVLVGDVEPKRAAEMVRKAFGGWKRLAPVPAFAVPAAPAPGSVLRLTVPMAGRSQTDVVYAVPGLARTDPDYDAAMMMNYVLGGGSLSSRLMDNLRDQQGLVYGVYSSIAAGIGAGPIQVRAGTNPANVDRAAASILEQVRRMAADGPTEDEMEDAKGYLTGVFPVRLETNAGVASQLLVSELYGLGLDYIDRYASIVRGVTREQAAAAAKKYLKPDTGYALVIAGSAPDAAGGGDAR